MLICRDIKGLIHKPTETLILDVADPDQKEALSVPLLDWLSSAKKIHDETVDRMIKHL